MPVVFDLAEICRIQAKDANDAAVNASTSGGGIVCD